MSQQYRSTFYSNVDLKRFMQDFCKKNTCMLENERHPDLMENSDVIRSGNAVT